MMKVKLIKDNKIWYTLQQPHRCYILSQSQLMSGVSYTGFISFCHILWYHLTIWLHSVYLYSVLNNIVPQQPYNETCLANQRRNQIQLWKPTCSGWSIFKHTELLIARNLIAFLIWERGGEVKIILIKCLYALN